MVVIIGYQLYDKPPFRLWHEHVGGGVPAWPARLAAVHPAALLPPSPSAADRFDRRKVAAFSATIDLTIALTLAVASRSTG